MKNVHVSGHAYQEEQLELMKLLKPRYFIPIHGEYRHLVLHSKTAQESGYIKESFVVENGTMWELTSENEVKTCDVIPTGRHWVFQDSSGTLDDGPIKDRRAAARAGVVVIECIVGTAGKTSRGPPSVTLRGFLAGDSKLQDVKQKMQSACELAFKGWSRPILKVRPVSKP